MELFRAEGRAQGAALLGRLISALLLQGKTEDAVRAASDEAYREQLYKEYQLS